jgi:hypothetical protein
LISHFVDGEDQKEVKLEWMRKRRGSPFLSFFQGLEVSQSRSSTKEMWLSCRDYSQASLSAEIIRDTLMIS